MTPTVWTTPFNIRTSHALVSVCGILRFLGFSAWTPAVSHRATVAHNLLNVATIPHKVHPMMGISKLFLSDDDDDNDDVDDDDDDDDDDCWTPTSQNA